MKAWKCVFFFSISENKKQDKKKHVNECKWRLEHNFIKATFVCVWKLGVLIKRERERESEQEQWKNVK